MQYYHVYVIVNEKDEIYIGYTSRIEKRLEGHNNGDTKSTRGHLWQLVYFESYLSQTDAKTREKGLKHDGRARYQLYRRIAHSRESQQK